MIVLHYIQRDRPVVLLARHHIERTFAEFFAKLATQVASAVRQSAEKVVKMGKDDEESDAAARAVQDASWDDLEDDVREQLQTVARDGGVQGVSQVQADVAAALNQVNEESVEWAKRRSAELVKEIAATTRDRVREAVAAGLEEGLSNEDLADELADSTAFSSDRALLIARTETAFADVAGNVIGWKASGVVAGREWRTSGEDPCPDCAEMDGEVVGIDEEFSDGDPPLHPRCECALLPVLAEDEG